MRVIDADALVAKLDDWRGDIEDVDKNDAHDVAYYSAMSRALRFAKDAPTLDYAPVKRGEWVTKPDGFIPADISCSECGKKYNFFVKPNFCPNCGARMDGKEDGKDDT